MKNFIYGALFISSLLLAGNALGDEQQESPFNCVVKTAALYSPGANWDKKDEYFAGHLEFILKNYGNKNLEGAGPFINDKEEPVGGLMITPLTGKDAAALFEQDPFVKNKAATVDLMNWNRCEPKKK
jgi:uncharacterized protein YciI